MFEDLYPSGNIQLLADLAFDTPRLLDERPRLADNGGFDEVIQRYLVRSAQPTVRLAAQAVFPKGRQLAPELLYIQEAGGRCLGNQLYEIEVTARGRVGPLRYHRRTGAQTQSLTAENITIFGYPGYPAGQHKVQGMDANPTVRTLYVTDVAPDLSKVSEPAGTLPVGYPALPAAPVNKWNPIEDPTYIVPSGWVLEARNSEDLPNEGGVAALWAVEDIHVHYQIARPS